jgi:hypothetical protein
MSFRSPSEFVAEAAEVMGGSWRLCYFLEAVCEAAKIRCDFTTVQTFTLKGDGIGYVSGRELGWHPCEAESEGHVESVLLHIYLTGQYYRVCEEVLKKKKKEKEEEEKKKKGGE